ncbi:MAG: DUF6787 family protein [Francisellaceae bacterium]
MTGKYRANPVSYESGLINILSTAFMTQTNTADQDFIEAIETQRQGFMARLKSRWNVKSNLDVIVILFVFSITGSAAVSIAAPIMHWIGLSYETTSGWIFWPIRIALICPLYQVLLLIIGSICGQGRFFLAFEKKTVGRLFKTSKSK